MLKQRIITALVLVALFLSALFLLPAGWFCLLVALVVLGASWEWGNLVGLQRTSTRLGYVLLAAGILWLADYLMSGASRDVQTRFLASACIWWTIALLWVQGFPSSAVLWGSKWVKALMGWFVLVPTWMAMTVLMGEPNHGPLIVLYVVLLVVLMDTGGYVAGRMFGRRKLAPNVSPGKTWAGFFGGLFANGLLVVVTGFALDADVRQWALLAVIVGITSCASVLGDLLESMVKRQRDVKDSGTLLPGHGGILDRVDGMTAAFPVFTLLYLLLAEGVL